MKKKFNYIKYPDNFLQIPFRFLSTIIVKKISKTRVTPNQITLFRGVINIISLFLFAIGNYLHLIIAFVLFQIFELLDHVDGDLATYKDMCSQMGSYLERIVDTFGSKTSNLFGLCVTIGVYRHTSDLRIFYIFVAIVFSRLLWLEFRETCGWSGGKGSNPTAYNEYMGISEGDTLKAKIVHFAITIYIWQNQLILWAALLSYPIEKHLQINPLFWAMIGTVVLNYPPLLKLFIDGYRRARRDKVPVSEAEKAYDSKGEDYNGS